MGLRTETRLLPGEPPLEITFTQLPAMRSLDLFLVLGRVLGPAFLLASDLDEDKDAGELAPILEGLFTRLGTGDGKLIVKEVLASAVVRVQEGKPPVVLNTQEAIDVVFNGRLQDMLTAVRAGLELNFGNFIDIISGLSGGVMKAREKSLSQTTPNTTGQSGASGLKAS